MRLSGYQPHYFPRLHYIQRALSSDIFEISDYLQFVKKHDFPLPDGTYKRGKSYQAHAVIKLQNGSHFLALPSKDNMLPINKTPIDYSQKWVRNHLSSLETAFSKSPNFKIFFPEISAILSKEYKSVGELTIQTVLWSIVRSLTDDALPSSPLQTKDINNLIKKTKHPFRLKTVVLASETPVKPPDERGPNAWIIALCRNFKAKEYYTGGTANNAYMNLTDFKKENIKVVVQDWKCKEYRQNYPKLGFLSNLSAVDLIMNESLDKRWNILL